MTFAYVLFAIVIFLVMISGRQNSSESCFWITRSAAFLLSAGFAYFQVRSGNHSMFWVFVFIALAFNPVTPIFLSTTPHRIFGQVAILMAIVISVLNGTLGKR